MTQHDGSAVQATTRRALWGHSRFGARRGSALLLAAPIGLALAAALGALAGWAAAPTGADVLLVAVVFALATALPMVSAVWLLVVDRSTVRGALDRPEESIESSWLDRASQGAFTDTLTIAGLGTAALFVSGADIPGSWTLLAVVVVMMASFGIRYLVARRA